MLDSPYDYEPKRNHAETDKWVLQPNSRTCSLSCLGYWRDGQVTSASAPNVSVYLPACK